MKLTIKRTAKKVAAVVLAMAMAFSVSPVVKGEAKKVKAPTISKKLLVLKEGDSATLKVKKGTYKIKKTTWKSANKKVAYVSKKGKVTAGDVGNTKITATVTTRKTKKKTKKYTLTCKVEVEEQQYEPEVEPGVWYCKDPEITDSIQAVADQLNSEIVGASFKPLIWLGYMIDTDGTTTYRILCRRTVTTEPAKTDYCIVEILEGMSGVIFTHKTVDIPDVGPYREVGDTAPGAWTECTGNLILPDEDATERSIRMALENQGLAGVDYTAIAKIGVNASSGSYCVICSEVAVVPYAPVNYAIFFVNVDHATGKVTIESDSTRHIDMYKTEE